MLSPLFFFQKKKLFNPLIEDKTFYILNFRKLLNIPGVL